MQELEDTQHFRASKWLFVRRLQFLGSQQQLRARTQNYHVSQELFLNAKKNDPGPIREIACFKDLKDAYKVFNSLVVRFRFNAKNLDQTFTRSRNELKGKKHLKQIQRQCKTKVKKLMEFLCIPDEEEQHWKTVLNHKNLIEHVLKANVFLKHFLDVNFQLIKQGGAHPKNQKLSKELQIYICVLAIDVLTLINNLKNLLAPFIQQQNNPSSNKVELQEKLLFETALEDSLKDQIDSIKNLEIQRFVSTIKRLSNQVHNNNYPFKAWISVQQIRQNFLIDKFGVPLKKFHSTAAKELMLYWHQLYIQHFNKTVNLNRERIGLKQQFEQYKIMFRYYLAEATKKQTQTCHVLQYLDLIQKIWVNIDLSSASSLFWQELALVSKKITLPPEFDKNSRDFVMDIVNNIINNFKAKQNQQFLQKVKTTILNLSMNLLSLERDEDLTEHYFLKNQKQLRLLLTERDVLDGAIKDIQNKAKKQDEAILSIINNISQKMTVDIKKKDFLMQSQYQKQVIENLYSVYQQDNKLIDEIKYFLLMARCLSNRSPSQEQLQACLSHYYRHRNGVLTNQQKLSSEQVNRLPFGILDCIKNFTFELVLIIKLNRPSRELDRLKKIIYKLLKVYEAKRKAHLRNTDESNQQQEQQEQLQVSSLLLRRSSSIDIDERWFEMEAQDVDDFDHDDQRYDDFTMSYLKKLFELRVEMIVQSVNELEEKQLPYREEFINIKGRIYTHAASSEKDLVLREDVKKLPEIQFDFIKRKYFEAWSALRKLKDIEGVNKILQQAWNGKRNVLKLFVTIFLKYKEPIFQAALKSKDLQGKNVQDLIDDSLRCEHRDLKIDSALKQDLINSIRILDSIEKVNQLKKELVEQDEQLSNLEEAKNCKSVREELRFKQIEDKLQIFAFMKNDVITMRKFMIKLQPNEIEDVYRKLRKLTQYNRNITLEINKQKDTIVMKVDDIQNSFDSYPKLVKFLIESYLEIIDFCKEQLNFQLYPLMLYNHFKIYKKNQHNIILKMNPYEGILLNAILPYKQLKSGNIYKYPKYPFIEFADQLSKKFQRDKIYDYKNTNKAEQFAFQHLIEEMKAISMEIQGGNFVEVAKAILKCPYFWSSADKLFEIVEFKQRYQSIVNIEQSRRKENEKIRESLKGQQKQAFTYWPPQKKHPNYKLAYGYNKTNQVYFSIEGLLQRQAFEEDIGNFRSNDVNQKYKFHGYHWSKDKTEIERLVKMVAEREKKKGSNTSFYDKTFNSFQNQIRNLRNLSVHYIYDSQQKKEIDLEDKLRIFETYFPKLFVFLYRWRPFLGKDYVNQIKPQKISLLKQLFCKQDNSQIIARLSSIKQLQTYNIKNNNGKNYLLELFNYDFARVNSCQPCKILCNSLKKQPSFWGFLQDVKRQNYKEGKDMTYNLLFWDHDKKGCNGMVNVLFAYFNVTQRNQFTTEQFAHVKSSLIMMQIEKSRLEQKIQKKLQNIAEMKKSKTPIGEEDNSPASDSESLEIQKNREPVEKRFKKLTARELDSLYDELVKLDYVCKYFIYQLEMELPYLFYDLRKERYQWDEKAWQYPKKE